HLRFPAGYSRDRRCHGHGTAMTDARLAELVERAFDYRGYVTLRRTDGSELVGFVYDRSASHLDLYDETATRRVRVSLADVADIAFTGDDAARKAQALWERRKGTLEPRETSAWGEWRESGPVLLLVALDRELRSLRYFEGELVCTTAVAATEVEKLALARPGALAVDMESYPVARAAAAAGIPWLAIRAIVDPLRSSLPAFTRDPAGGYVGPA